MNEVSEVGIYPKPVLRPVITGDEHGLFCKFMKMEPSVFKSTKSEDAFEFLINYRERLHKMGIVDRYVLEFVSFRP